MNATFHVSRAAARLLLVLVLPIAGAACADDPCEDSGSGAPYTSDHFSTGNPDFAPLAAECEKAGCISRQRAICLAREQGVREGLIGIRATLDPIYEDTSAPEGTPAPDPLPPPTVIGFSWSVWNVEEVDEHARSGQFFQIDALSEATKGPDGWLMTGIAASPSN